ncbi:MAG: hypothetical protein VYE22_23890 [Myxococcota bacterium]|nr:hypothetical protein [Myxococcota bacterium]
MTTPAPHTPINMVKGGNSLFFSAQCVALLAKCGYSPDDFGTYDQVQKRCSQARDKCATFDAQKKAREEAIARGVPESEAPAVTAPEPSDHERFLASCQSGHIAQDASMRNSTDGDGNAGRGNPCANDGRVDGYETRLAPCMPHQGAADEPGSQHHLVSNLENSQPVSDGASRGSDYDPTKLDADCQARTDQALQWREETAGDWNLAADNGKPGEQPEITDASAAAYFEGTDPKKSAELQGTPKELTGDTAAECIESFRKAGEAEMKAKCARDVEKNEAIANGGEGKTAEEGAAHRERLKTQAETDAAEAEKRKGEMHTANRSRGQRQRALNDAIADYRANPTPENKAKLKEKAANYAQSNRDARDAAERYDSAAATASDSRRAHNRARYAECRREQGERMNEDGTGGSHNPRVPGYNTFADPSPSSGGASGT